jgi:hypothetical protein
VRITSANNLDHAKLGQRAIDVPSRLMAQAGQYLRGIAASRKVCLTPAETGQFAVKRCNSA